MTTLEQAIASLQDTLDHARDDNGTWRWRIGQGLSGVRDALGCDQFRSRDGWLSARSHNNDRECRRLIGRIAAIGPAVIERLELDVVRVEVDRLITDVEHYRQRLHDLIYDSVALEIGGSE